MGKKVSRRKFLTYTLGGTAGFLASGVLFPMVRFAVDPVLKQGEGEQYVDVNLTVIKLQKSLVRLNLRFIAKMDGMNQKEEKN